jgi:hypothetical protein
MAYPQSLAANQQTALLAFMPKLRGNPNNSAKLANNFPLLNNLCTNGGISAINAGLSVGDIVPDATGLAGAQTLSSADLNTAMAAVQAFLASHNTAADDAYSVRAVGPANAASV